MAAELRRDIRIAVVGSSTAFMTVPHRTSRHDGPYPEHLGAELSSLGIGSSTVSHTRWHGMINEARPHIETYRTSLPDVVIINYGMAECQPQIMPTGIYRNFVTWMSGTRRLEVAYRRKVMPWVWKRVRGYQRVATKVVKGRTHRLSPYRFQLEMTKTIKALLLDHAPLILVLDIDPVNAKVEHFVPGLGKRVVEYNGYLRKVVDSFDNPDVRLVETSSVIEQLGIDVALPDGFHRSSVGHRHVAAMLSAEIAPWAKAQFG